MDDHPGTVDHPAKMVSSFGFKRSARFLPDGLGGEVRRQTRQHQLPFSGQQVTEDLENQCSGVQDQGFLKMR